MVTIQELIDLAKVITVLRKLPTYLREEELLDICFEPVLFAPRARARKVLPCFSSEEINIILNSFRKKGLCHYPAWHLHRTPCWRYRKPKADRY
jgi:hypothetical protein